MRMLRRVFFIAIVAMFVTTQAQAVLFWARPYDPNLQRWIQRDPIGEQGGINLYGYVDNNPVNHYDPFGLCLVVDPSLKDDFYKAGHYLYADNSMKLVIKKLIESPNTYYIKPGVTLDDDYFDGSKTVYWNPHSALKTTSGGKQSPALGLGHELAHAQGFDFNPDRFNKMATPHSDLIYDTKEESRVIMGPETSAAKTLGEDTRQDHGGASYPVSSCTAR
jgi:uncharacterized protein RhaS with RHS repeats